MIHRMFQVIETGAWCAPVLSDEQFPDDGAAYATQVALDLGLPGDALRVVDLPDGEPDPRVGDLITYAVVDKVDAIVAEPLVAVAPATQLRGA